MSEASRLRWRCRRGTKELDVVLERFVSREYERLGEAERAALERLLDEEDDRLVDWLLTARERPADGEVAALVERIRHLV
ncbi:succinate dehydrogenase assembly factor 2 [Arhodomonas sp. SL1]|uniref:FAD assembly factor SdhE n=1 Tax=Arhodomonas sp. SL1 TaxID=3425691 RepID=UPI003F8827A0